jgi:predicted nucleic acid-binding protein
MRLVLDASVVVASAKPREPSHAASRARFERALHGVDELVQPALFVVEVSGALARLGFPDADVVAILDPICARPHRIVTIGPRGAAKAAAVARSCKLRGADALYVWLAIREGIPLCTLDREMIARAPAGVQLVGP